MKLSICAEKGNKKAEVLLTKREVRGLYDWFYICGDYKRCTETLKLNEIKLLKPHKKFEHFVHDIMDEGKAYRLEKQGKKSVLKLLSKPNYFVKKPKWQSK